MSSTDGSKQGESLPTDESKEKLSEALFYCGEKGNVQRCKELLRNGANVNWKAGRKLWFRTPLMQAAKSGMTEVCQLYLEHGADVNACTASHFTAIILAARYGHSETCKLLLSKGANINIQTKDGETALMWAADHGHSDTCKLLLEAGAEINLQDIYGFTALIRAARGGHAETCIVLLDLGADLHAVSTLGNQVWDAEKWAEMNKHLTIVKLLKKSTAVSNLQNAPKVICINCKDDVPLTLWQDHQMICEGGSSKETGDRCEESRDDRDNYVHTPMVQKSSTEERNTTQPTGEFSSAAVPIKNFDEMLGEILDVIPDANEQDVRKKLLATSSVEETLDWMLEQQNTIYQNSVMLKDLDPSEALETFRQATIMKLPYQTIRINRDSPHFIREVFKLFKKGIDVKKAPDVEFEGEDGMDASGLTREYLYLLMSKIRGGDGTTVLFEGQPGHLSPLYDVDCLDSGFYFFVGQALAQSFLHGGYPFVGMSQAVAHYIITDDIDESIPFLAVEDIPDPEVRDVLKKIASASKDEDFQNLNADEGVSNLLIQCGFVNKLLNKQNSQQACQRVLVHQVLMYKKDPIQEIRRGLQTASITSFLKDHPALWKTIFATAADVKLQSDLVVRSLKCDPSVGELNEQQETILNWCKEYVGNLPSDTESDSSTIEKFVQFVFGEPTMPPQPVYVKFNRPGKSLPDADACTGTISLPIDHKMKKDFTKSLDIVLNFQHKGFGRC